MIAVIGGGAAGMIAAITAARQGAMVKLFEKKDRVGKKLLATGNGRCNVTNEDLSLSHFHIEEEAERESDFIRSVFEQVSMDQIEAFWHSLGLELVTLERGKRYPMSLQAASVLDALRFECERLGVSTLCETEIEKIIPQRKGKNTHFQIQGRRNAPLGTFDQVIVTVGGKASPQFGSDGAGQKLAGNLKLKFVPLRPAIVRLSVESPFLKGLAGCKIVGEAALYDTEDHLLQKEEGEILFTAEGLSGPPILDLAREALREGRRTQIQLRLFPGVSSGELFMKIRSRAEQFSYMTVSQMLSGILHKRLILPVCKKAGVESEKQCLLLTKKEMTNLAKVLTDWRFPVLGSAGWKEAQVTVGGISTSEINPMTMGIWNYPGMFAAGEVLDVDGDCGGYNITWAAGSAILAGTCAAQRENGKAEIR